MIAPQTHSDSRQFFVLKSLTERKNLSSLLQHRIQFKENLNPDTTYDSLRQRHRAINKPSAFLAPSNSTTPTAGSGVESDAIPRGAVELQHLQWQNIYSIGAGLQNVGNTCFLNSVLQCLIYTSPLANYLISSKHQTNCTDFTLKIIMCIGYATGFCSLCAMHELVLKLLCDTSRTSSTTLMPIIPRSFIKSLKGTAHVFS